MTDGVHLLQRWVGSRLWEYNTQLLEQVHTRADRSAQPSLEMGIVNQLRWHKSRRVHFFARRLCQNYEELPEHGEGVIYILMIRLMLARLDHNQRQRIP